MQFVFLNYSSILHIICWTKTKGIIENPDNTLDHCTMEKILHKIFGPELTPFPLHIFNLKIQLTYFFLLGWSSRLAQLLSISSKRRFGDIFNAYSRYRWYKKKEMYIFYKPIWKTVVLCRGNIRLSVWVFRTFFRHYMNLPNLALTLMKYFGPYWLLLQLGIFFEMFWSINLKVGLYTQ